MSDAMMKMQVLTRAELGRDPQTAREQIVAALAGRRLLLLQYLEEAGKGGLGHGQLACKRTILRIRHAVVIDLLANRLFALCNVLLAAAAVYILAHPLPSCE